MTHPASSGAALPRPGDLLGGKYRLDREIGKGGMGAVYAAKHLELDKDYAIKVMLADTSNQEAMQRFQNEGRAAARIDSEHVVKVFDVVQEFGLRYMVIELLQGEDLGQILERQGKLPPHVLVGYMLQALKGVGKAHSKGIIHRDLKPSNLFLHRREEGPPIVKVLDFGISKAASNASPLGQAPSALTSTRAMLGSPLYMSPEQLRSSKSVDHRADIWAIGVIMYELLTGQLPFGGENLGELFAAILEQDAPSLRLKSPEVPEGLERVVLKCLQRRPEQRYDSVAAIAADLAPYEGPGAGLMATAFMPSPSSFAQQAPPRFGGVTPNPPLQQTAPTNPGVPPFGAVTPSGTGPRPAAAGTVAMGRGTNGGWQSTGSGQMALPKSKTPIIIGAASAVFLVVGMAGIGAVYLKRRADAAGTTATTATSAPPPPPVSVSAEPPPTPPAPPATSTPPTQVSVAAPTPPAPPAHKPPIGASHVPHTPPKPPPVAVNTEPPPKPPEPPPPKPPVTKPPTVSPPTAGTATSR
jgi:serine/threonine-protein kinase